MPRPADPDRPMAHVRDHQVILIEFARVAAEITDTQRLLDLACQHAARATGVQHSKILRYRSDKGDMLAVAGRGWKPGVIGQLRLGADMASPPGRAYQTRELVAVGDIEDAPDYRMPPTLRDHGIRSMLNAPVAINGVVWGTLEVDSPAPWAFDEDDERFLTALALIVALAIRHRRAQEERERAAEDMGRRLAQAHTLMQEQNHRVRNYFQMILAMLAARGRRSADHQERSDYRDIMDRVTAIGLAHDLLTVEEGESTVDAATYLDALCEGMQYAAGQDVRIDRVLESLRLRPDRAVPLGLILNELITNAIKYAIPHRPESALSVRFGVDVPTDEAVLEVRDAGPGMGDGRRGGTGLRLVRSLAGQISGRIDIQSSDAGSMVFLRFPIIT